MLAVFSFSQEDLKAYHAFSRDENPIHQTGVIFGIQLMACIEEILIEKWQLKETRNFSYYFLAKIMVETQIELFGKDNHMFEVWCCGKKVGEGVIGNV
ncbi:hypothetical protein [Enterococcus sp. DIV1420a]|uniref:hypothetical protein n=1 Tax=Enterococcus sp. DIV1420a TaxID=2774672 RepID=UPI003F68302E